MGWCWFMSEALCAHYEQLLRLLVVMWINSAVIRSSHDRCDATYPLKMRWVSLTRLGRRTHYLQQDSIFKVSP